MTKVTEIRRVEVSSHDRVGIYITPQTRARLNFLKLQLTAMVDRPLNIDEAITHLLDKEGVPVDGRAALRSARRRAAEPA